MIDLNSLALFAKVVENGTFSATARRLNIPLSTVSRKIAELEDALGVRLLERSTRHLTLTEIGSEVLAQAQQSAEVSETVTSLVSNRLTDVKGLIRLTAPPSIADSLISPIVTSFQVAYPSVRVHTLVTDRHVDHITEGVDLAFRVGEMKDSSLVAKQILKYRHQMVASPDYLKQYSAPKHPRELLEHRLIAFSYFPTDSTWVFYNSDNDKDRVVFQSVLSMNDYTGIATALASGVGIGDLPPIVAPELLRSGELVEVMTDWRLKPKKFSLVHTGARHMARPVRLFKDFAARMALQLFPDLPN